MNDLLKCNAMKTLWQAIAINMVKCDFHYNTRTSYNIEFYVVSILYSIQLWKITRHSHCSCCICIRFEYDGKFTQLLCCIYDTLRTVNFSWSFFLILFLFFVYLILITWTYFANWYTRSGIVDINIMSNMKIRSNRNRIEEREFEIWDSKKNEVTPTFNKICRHELQTRKCDRINWYFLFQF